jgi:hypothetical protein
VEFLRSHPHGRFPLQDVETLLMLAEGVRAGMSDVAATAIEEALG